MIPIHDIPHYPVNYRLWPHSAAETLSPESMGRIPPSCPRLLAAKEAHVGWIAPVLSRGGGLRLGWDFFENFKCAYDYLTAIPSMYGSAVLCDFVWA